MVRRCAASLLALALFSCGNSHFAAEDVQSPDEIIEGESEDAVEAFEAVEQLRDNPIDPKRASIDELLSIRGFPEPLARSVRRSVLGRHPGRSWVDDLTPPERAELYRFSEFIRLPERPSSSFRTRIAEDGIGSAGAARIDCRSALAGDCWKVLVRSRDLDCVERSSFYASAAIPSGALRFHAGSFAPDFAQGLVFGGGFDAYPFSGSYPLRGSRWIAGTTSFYVRALTGGAVELWHRSMRVALISGRPRVFKVDRFEPAGSPVYAGRLGLSRGSWEAGLCAVDRGAAARRPFYSISGAWKAEPLKAGFEVAGDGSCDPACAWGASCHSGKTRSAFLFHAIPPGMSGPFGRINARQLAPAYSYQGMTVAAEREVSPGIRVRASLERSRRADDSEEDRQNAFRAECERKGRRLRLKLSWSSRVDGGSRLIPYPGERGVEGDRNAAFGFLSVVKIAGRLTGRISGRYSEGNGHRGILVSPSLSLGLFSGRLMTSGSLAAYRSLEGRQIHYFYEPSPTGTYPWISVSGSGYRGSFLMSLIFKRLSASSKVVLDGGKGLEAGLQATLNID